MADMRDGDGVDIGNVVRAILRLWVVGFPVALTGRREGFWARERFSSEFGAPVDWDADGWHVGFGVGDVARQSLESVAPGAASTVTT